MKQSGATVIHRMADGTICEDITGKIIPVTPITEPAYRIIARAIQRMLAESQETLQVKM